MDMPRMDLLSLEDPSIWEWAAHCLLCIYGILFVFELAEGKDHTRQADPLEFEALGGKTVGLLLCMMGRYFATGRYVILDSGFCELKGLIELKKKGISPCDVM